MASVPATIRMAEQADFKEIADLINRLFDIERSYVEEEAETEYSIANEVKRGSLYFVAVGSQGLIGCVCINAQRRAIFKLAVETSLRQRGYGRMLMSEAERYAKATGWPYVRVGILDFGTELLEYYRKLGYVEAGKTDVLLIPPARLVRPCQLILMSKQLV